MNTPRVSSDDLHTPAGRKRVSEMPVDMEHLRRYTLGDQALESEILDLFLAQLPQTLAALKTAATERDWKIAAHTLKGSSRAVGAWRIATLAQEAEGLAITAAPEAWSEAISKLEAAASEASSFVKEAAHRA